MSYLPPIFTDHPLIDAVMDFHLSNKAARAAVAATRARSPLTAIAHRMSSTMLAFSAVCNWDHHYHRSDHYSQWRQGVKRIVMLPVGLFETFSALCEGKKYLAFAYFGSTVVPGALSLADVLHRMYVLSANTLPSIHRIGDTTSSYSMPRGPYDPFANHTDF